MFRDTLRVPVVVALAAAALALAGCTTSEEPVYRMMVDSATLDASATCADGSIPSATFAVHTDLHAGKTAPAGNSLSPVWLEGVLTTFAPEWARGIGFEVTGTCPEGEVVLGGARVRPGADAFRGRIIVMGPFDKVTQVQVHWQRLVPVSSSGGGGGVYFDGGYYEDGGTYDDGGYDDGSYDDGGYDDGSYDDGCYDASCYDGDDDGGYDDGGYDDDGSYDDGDDGYDDGGYDDGSGDDSGDDGSEGDWD